MKRIIGAATALLLLLTAVGCRTAHSADVDSIALTTVTTTTALAATVTTAKTTMTTTALTTTVAHAAETSV